MERLSLSDSGVLASDETFRLESRRLGAGLSTGIAFSKSDVVLLFFDGDLKLSTADRVRAVTAPAHAYVNEGTAFDITAGGDDVSYLIATCPATGLEAAQNHELANIGDGRLEVWLTVTPNVTPSHTFYEKLTNGTWNRITPRLDGQESLPPSR